MKHWRKWKKFSVVFFGIMLFFAFTLPLHAKKQITDEQVAAISDLITILPEGIFILTNTEIRSELFHRKRLILCGTQNPSLTSRLICTILDKLPQLSFVKEVRLCGLGLTKFPTALLTFKRLRALHLTCNLITSIPEEIGLLTHLTYLDLGWNSIRILPNNLGKLTRLNELYLEDNQLYCLPPTIGRLHALQHLDLTNNKIYKLPFIMRELSNLVTLKLSGNNTFLMTKKNPHAEARSLKEQFGSRIILPNHLTY